MIPHRIRHLGKMILRPDYRTEQREIARLRGLPKYTPATTNLLAQPVAMVDPEAFLSAYRDIFQRQIYRFTPQNDNPLIIDGGANIGMGVLFFKQLCPQSRVIAFEPDANVFATLQQNCHNFGYNDVTTIQKALWREETILEFVPEGSESGRLARLDDRPTLNEAKVVRMPTARLRDYLDEPVEFLKIDIEGAEYEVLADCADKLCNVRQIFVEYHSFVSEPQELPALLLLLKEAGFRFQIEQLLPSEQPFVSRLVNYHMDYQANIFGFRA